MHTFLASFVKKLTFTKTLKFKKNPENNQCSFVAVKHHLRKAWRDKIHTEHKITSLVALDIWKDCPPF